MTEFVNSLIESGIQCYGCPVFDRLFQIISTAAAAVYDQFVFFSFILFLVLFAFFAWNVVWKSIREKTVGQDPFLQKSVKPVFINSLVALAFLGMGVALPRFVTQITFEPVAQITLAYTQSMLRTDSTVVTKKITYQPEQMPDDGFFRPQLRDTIILLMQTTITQFQSYVKLGVAIMDSAFSWRALTGVGELIKHITLFFVGLYLAWGFFKLFVRFCFYFADIIVAMTFFAFFFPLSIAMISFRGGDGVPQWMTGLGKNLGTGQIKKLINAIITLSAAVLTYTVIMNIIAQFFSEPGQSAAEITQLILSGDVFAADLSDNNLAQITTVSAVVLVYVVNFLQTRIPEVTNMVLAAFNVSTENGHSEKLADNVMGVTKAVTNTVTQIGKAIISGGETTDDKEKKK